MSEATGMEARTIHRLLEVDPKAGGFRRGLAPPLTPRPHTVIGPMCYVLSRRALF
jgi:hypothetical protein